MLLSMCFVFGFVLVFLVFRLFVVLVFTLWFCASSFFLKERDYEVEWVGKEV